MDLTRPEDLTEALMRGHSLTSAELDRFLANNPLESQFHDYKSGDLTQKPNLEKGRKTIREWVTGFANADGGTLIIGPSDKPPHAIAGCQSIGKEHVADWAQKALADVVGMFAPAPRFCIVNHPQGDVLLIATERAPQLIPVIEARRWTYHLRINTSTVQVPDYLISDLVLGRRQRPVLEIKVRSAADWVNTEDRLALNVRAIKLGVVVENRSIVRAEKVQVGIVGWTAKAPVRNDHVLTYVDSITPEIDLRDLGDWSSSLVVQSAGSQVAVPAFEELGVEAFSGTLWVPCFTRNETGRPFTYYRCGSFVASETSPPTWFQIDVEIYRPERFGAAESEPIIKTRCRRVPQGERPVVACYMGERARAEVAARAAEEEL